MRIRLHLRMWFGSEYTYYLNDNRINKKKLERIKT